MHVEKNETYPQSPEKLTMVTLRQVPRDYDEEGDTLAEPDVQWDLGKEKRNKKVC